MSETIEKSNKLEEAPKESGESKSLDTIDFLEEPERKVKRLDSETLTLNGDKYKIVKDYREALDLELLEERYSDFLEKYDYIVGDISYEKLRLRGFYDDKNKKVPIDMRISSLEDYLLEYCSFGCKYFVLERMEPKKKFRNKSKRKRSNQNNYQKNKKQKNLEKFEKVKRRKEQHKKRQKETTSNKKNFVKKERKKEEIKQQNHSNETQKENKVKTVKDQKGNTKFQIRRKK